MIESGGRIMPRDSVRQVEWETEDRILPPIVRASFGVNNDPVRIHESTSLATITDYEHLSSHTHHVVNDNPDRLPKIVCGPCQDILLHVYGHCLDTRVIPSTNTIDEIADGLSILPAPLFDVIRDPTVPLGPIIGGEQIRGHNRLGELGLGVRSGKVFSGPIYKRVLQAQQREIVGLRSKLHESGRREVGGAANVELLRKALGRAVGNSVCAEEWRVLETKRLQEDVRWLKTETSSLVAGLIDAEVVSEMEAMKVVIIEREADTAGALKTTALMKERLQASYRDFIALDEAMKLKTLEAANGSQAVEEKNLMMQRNLQTLTVDFGVAARDLKAATNKSRELEYELTQISKDLEVKGEGLKKATTIGIATDETLRRTAAGLKKLKETHDLLILAKEKIEADGRAEYAKNEQQKKDLRKAAVGLTDELEAITNENQEVKTFLGLVKGDLEEASKKILVLGLERDEVTSTLVKTTATSKTEIGIRDTKIAQLTARIARDEISTKVIYDKKELLQFQVSDLQKNLDIEVDNGLRFEEELDLLKKSSTKKISVLTDLVEKGTATKLALLTVQRELSDTIAALQKDVAEKAVDLDKTKAKFKDVYSKQTGELDSTKGLLGALHLDHKILNEKHDILTIVCDKSIKDNIELKRVGVISTNLQEKTDAELVDAKNVIQQLLEEKSQLQTELRLSKEAHAALFETHTTVVAEKEGVIRINEEFKTMADEQGRERNVEQHLHIAELTVLRSEDRVTKSRVEELENMLAETTFRLADTIKELMKETDIRETLEAEAQGLRMKIQEEKRIRSELERIHVHAKYFIPSDTTYLENRKTRDRKLQALSVGMAMESSRMKELVTLFPTDGFGNEELFTWPANLDYRIETIKK